MEEGALRGMLQLQLKNKAGSGLKRKYLLGLKCHLLLIQVRVGTFNQSRIFMKLCSIYPQVFKVWKAKTQLESLKTY